MILYPKVKPVQIRILYKGKEHYSLETIRQDFEFEEIKKLLKNPQFYKWLNQQNYKDVNAVFSKWFNGSNDNKEPKLIDLLYLFFSDIITKKENSFFQIYKKFENSNKYKNVAYHILLKEYIQDPLSKDVNKILRSLNSNQLKNLGIIEWEVLKNNYDLSESGDNEAKQFIKKYFNWLKYESLKVLFYSSHPDNYNRFDLPKILTFWKENGFQNKYNDYISKYIDFIANDSLLSSFTPNYDYNERFKNFSTDEIIMVEMLLEQIKEGKMQFPDDTEIKKDYPNLKKIKEVLISFNLKVSQFKRGIYSAPYNLPHTENNIYDIILNNIIKKYCNASFPNNKKTEIYRDFWINIKFKIDAMKSYKALFDAYLFNEKKFKRLHPDFPYII